MFRKVNPRRQLNEEETRAYAAGMAAKRRGDVKPAEYLPDDLYGVWRMGWNRVGRPIHSGSVFRSCDHTTKSEGMHMVRTEVETLDQALDVLEIERRSKKATATRIEKPRTWKDELRDAEGAERFRRLREKRATELVAFKSAASELEGRIVERVTHVIEALCFTIDEISTVSAMNSHYPLINPKSLIDVITTLCHMIKKDIPSFHTVRAPGQHSRTRRCINCGAELASKEIEYCLHCESKNNSDSIRIASELRREHVQHLAGLESQAKELGKLIGKTQRALRHGSDQGHGGHSSTNVASMEAGGREENLDSGGAASHRDSENDIGDAESRDRGGASDPSERSANLA